MKKYTSEKETPKQQFWKGYIRKRTILNRKHFKQDNSENDKSEKENYENEHWWTTILNKTSEKGQFWTWITQTTNNFRKGKIWIRTLKRHQLNKTRCEQEQRDKWQFRKGQIWKITFVKMKNLKMMIKKETIWNTTSMNRKHLKKIKTEKDESEKWQSWTGKSAKWQSKKGTIWRRKVLKRNNMYEKAKYEIGKSERTFSKGTL